jgi:hypothetical protein
VEAAATDRTPLLLITLTLGLGVLTAASCGGSDSTATVSTPDEPGAIVVNVQRDVSGPNATCNTSLITFTATPLNVTGTFGKTTTQTILGNTPSNPVTRPAIEGSGTISYCEIQREFLDLATGTWTAAVSGAETGACPSIRVVPRNKVRAQIRNGRCT